MDNKNMHTEHYTALSYMVDADCRISLPAVLMLLQEAAWHHANNHDFGYKGLLRRQLYWVLWRMRVEMLRYPAWTEPIKIQTWSKQPDNLTAYRDFEGYDGDNCKFLAAASSWLILDMENRRPQPAAIYANEFPHLANKHAIAQKPQKIAAPINAAIAAHGIVQPSDIDMHQHANNTRYIQWVLDSFGFDFLSKNQAAVIDINFLSQAKAGDQYAIAAAAHAGSACTCSIINKDTSREMARVKILWQPKNTAAE
jgi:acyl-ACP thioesterase